MEKVAQNSPKRVRRNLAPLNQPTQMLVFDEIT